VKVEVLLEVAREAELGSILRNRFDRNLPMKFDLVKFKFVNMRLHILKTYTLKFKIIVHYTQINMLYFLRKFVTNLRLKIYPKSLSRNGVFV
jgi:hypothetical protein